jgi:hypothetical protein
MEGEDGRGGLVLTITEKSQSLRPDGRGVLPGEGTSSVRIVHDAEIRWRIFLHAARGKTTTGPFRAAMNEKGWR